MNVTPGKNSGEVVLAINRRDEPLLASAATTPFLLKKILVPIDFSDCSKKALKYALPLAKQHGATITLFYVVPGLPQAVGDYGTADYPTLEADLRATAEKELDQLLVHELGGKVPGETVVGSGSPSISIIELAKNMPADIIIISTHGRTGLKHVLLGSVAEHVVRHAPCPVLVVREREHEFLA